LTTFKELGLSDDILKAITELGFEKPSDIQTQAIPTLLSEDTDFIGLAQTGTGKTAAFGLPLLQRIDPSKKHTQALVLAPTRELGQQIADQLYKYSKYMARVNVLPVYGGTPIYNQIKELRKPTHVIIATPGRLIDLIKRKAVNLQNLEMLILDEADEMLNMGFKEEIDEILSYASEDKYTWLFSATMAKEIKKIVKKYMDEPVEVKVNTKNEVNANIDHQYVLVRNHDKMEAMTRFIDLNQELRGVVFCRTKRDTQNLAEDLAKAGYQADALHGDLSQAQRDRVMRRFKAHDLRILVATDVAARGIDVDDLTHVFHFTLPDQNEYYTHRSGRTARAGKKGISITFISGRETYRIYSLERLLGIQFTKVQIPSSEAIAESRIERWCHKIIKTKTKGRIHDEALEKVTELFEEVTREALIKKLLVAELEQLGSGSGKDLNDFESRGGGGGRRDRGRGRGGDRRRGGGGFRRGGGGSYGGGGRRRRTGGSDRDGDRDRDSRGSGDRRSGGGDRRNSSDRSSSGERKKFGSGSFKKKKRY